MKSSFWHYVVLVVLFGLSICGFGLGILSIAWGGVMVLGSTAPSGQQGWATYGGIFIVVGLLIIGAAIALIVMAIRRMRDGNVQNVTYKVDLPGDTKIEQVKCRSCGGNLTADNIKMVNGAPMVTCPYCNSVYQLTEEPKW